MVAPSLVMVTSPVGDVIILSMPRGPSDVRSVSAIARPATMFDSRMFCSDDWSFFRSPVDPLAVLTGDAAGAAAPVLAAAGLALITVVSLGEKKREEKRGVKKKKTHRQSVSPSNSMKKKSKRKCVLFISSKNQETLSISFFRIVYDSSYNNGNCYGLKRVKKEMMTE